MRSAPVFFISCLVFAMLAILSDSGPAFADTCDKHLGYRYAPLTFEESVALDFKSSLENVSPKTALKDSIAIIETVRAAGNLIDKGQLVRAHSLLDNEKLFRDTGFDLMDRGDRYNHIVLLAAAETALATSPKAFALFLDGTDARSPPHAKAALTRLGIRLTEMTIFQPNSDGTKTEESLWWPGWTPSNPAIVALRTSRLREMAEEFLHAAQYLQHHSTGSPIISSLLNDNPRLLARVHRFARKPSPTGSHHGSVLEADVYAAMIELLGNESVPVWVRKLDGYEIRALIDTELGRRLTPRRWESILVTGAAPRPAVMRAR